MHNMSANNEQAVFLGQIEVNESDVIEMLSKQISDMAVKIAVLEAFIQKGGAQRGHDPVPN